MDKILEIVKKYWWVSLIIAALVYSHIRISNMETVVNTTVQASNSQIESLKKSNDEEIKKKDDLIQAHEKELKELEDNYQQKSAELETERAKKIKVIVKYYENPQKLADKITATWDLKYVK